MSSMSPFVSLLVAEARFLSAWQPRPPNTKRRKQKQKQKPRTRAASTTQNDDRRCPAECGDRLQPPEGPHPSPSNAGVRGPQRFSHPTAPPILRARSGRRTRSASCGPVGRDNRPPWPRRKSGATGQAHRSCNCRCALAGRGRPRRPHLFEGREVIPFADPLARQQTTRQARETPTTARQHLAPVLDPMRRGQQPSTATSKRRCTAEARRPYRDRQPPRARLSPPERACRGLSKKPIGTGLWITDPSKTLVGGGSCALRMCT